MQEITRAKRLSQALVHFVTALASLFTDQRMSDLSTRAKYKHFKTICGRTFGQFSNHFQFFFLEVMVVSLFVGHIFVRISSHDLPYHKSNRLFSRALFPNPVTCQLLRRRFVIRTSFYTPQ